MMLAIEDLLHAPPHMRTSARFSPAERRAYHEGYYWGVVYALRVVVEAVANYQAVSRQLRAAAKRKRSA